MRKMWDSKKNKSVGQIIFLQMRKREGKTEETANGNRRRRVKKSLNLSGAAVTCVSKAY